jgi:hypothetical protein
MIHPTVYITLQYAVQHNILTYLNQSMRKYSYSLAQHFIYNLVKVTRFFHYMFRLNIRVILRWFLILR